MKEQPFDDETLMAFADGELDAATAEAVEDAINHDDELMARVAMFMETRTRAKSEMASLLDEAVPAELERSVRAMVEASREAPEVGDDASSNNVVAFDIASRGNSRWRSGNWALPIAASLVMAIATGFVGYQLGNTGGQGVMSVAGPAPDVVAALQSVASGEERQLDGGGSNRIRMVSSFRDEDGTFCREYEIDPPQGSSLISVSCVEAGEWTTKIAIATPLGGDGYAPASAMEALEAYLSAINAGPALSQEEEAQALTDLP